MDHLVIIIQINDSKITAKYVGDVDLILRQIVGISTHQNATFDNLNALFVHKLPDVNEN